MSATRTRYLAAIVLFGLVWFWGLGHRPLFATDEGRYAEIPREMLASGDWVTPRLDGLRYFEKPPLQYWATAAAYAVFGVHDWVARLWSAVSGFLTVLLVGFAADRLYGVRAGWLAAAVLAGSFYFGILAHFNTLDAGLTFTMSLVLIGFLLAMESSPGSKQELAWMLVAYGGAALAVLSKGLIGILLPGAVLVLYLAAKRDVALLRRLHIPPGIALFLLLVLPWFVAVSIANKDFLYQFFIAQEFLRFLTPVSQRPGPWWYFFPLLMLALLPWLVVAARAIIEPVRRLAARRDFDPTAVLWWWIVFIFVFFSASHSKLPSYILPIIPAFALLAGRGLGRREHLPWADIGLSFAAAILVLILAALGPLAMRGVEPMALESFAPWLATAGAIVAVATGAAIALRRRPTGAVALVAAGWMIATRLVMLGAAAFGPHYSTRTLAAQVASYNQPGTPIYSVGGYQQTLPFYLRRTMILVAYHGELEFGIRHARKPLAGRYLGSLEDFAAAWRRDRDALAFVPREVMGKVEALGIRYRIVARNPRWLALVRP